MPRSKTSSATPPSVRMLIPEPDIRYAVADIAKRIEEDLRRHPAPDPVLVVGIMDGALIFMADLVRRLPLSMEWRFVKASSYGRSRTSSGTVALDWFGSMDWRGRNVIVIDDILDTGLTMKTIVDVIREGRPNRLLSVVLLRKQTERTVAFDVDYAAFDIPDTFVVGYGLDDAGRFRNLPYIGALEPD
ncbi:MAG: hypoxanthine phosphoribosyltransferase [Planctomycetota bacterium]